MGRVSSPSAIARKRTQHLLQRYKEGDRTARDLLALAYEAGARDAATALDTTPSLDASPDSGEKYADMDVAERAAAMANDGVGDPWELLGYFREKLRQSEMNGEVAREAAARLAIRLRDALAPSPEAPANRQEAGEVERLREAVRLTIADAAYHLEKYRPHCLEALHNALTSPKDVKGGGR